MHRSRIVDIPLPKQGESEAIASPPHDALAALIERAGEARPLPPVAAWHPAHCGAIDIAIDPDGNWFHEGGRIAREPLVRLFASILRREADGCYCLVTPAEKLAISVADVPFVAVEMAEDHGTLVFRTSVGDLVRLDQPQRLRMAFDGDGGAVPYLCVRDGLEARMSRNVALEFLDRAVESDGEWGVRSNGHFFVIAAVGEERPA